MDINLTYSKKMLDNKLHTSVRVNTNLKLNIIMEKIQRWWNLDSIGVQDVIVWIICMTYMIISCMSNHKTYVDQYISNYYRNETYEACYSHMIFSTNGESS